MNSALVQVAGHSAAAGHARGGVQVTPSGLACRFLADVHRLGAASMPGRLWSAR
jgi:hypothetical protein